MNIPLLLATVEADEWMTLFLAIVGTVIPVVAIYSLCYVGANLFSDEGRERLHTTVRGLKRGALYVILIGFLGGGLFLFFRLMNPTHSNARVAGTTLLVGLGLPIGYIFFVALIESSSGHSSKVGQTVERGREIGTLAEARDALRQQTHGEPASSRLGRRGLVSSFLENLTGRR